MLVLDFDGTLSDAEKEGVPFRDGYLADLAAICNADVLDVLTLADRLERQIDPQRDGWEYNGLIVAPATVDPYLRIMPVAKLILSHFGVFTQDPDARTRLLDRVLYKYNYPKTRIVFREGAFDFLQAVRSFGGYVVTNSATDHVRTKIRALGGGDAVLTSTVAVHNGPLEWLAGRVHGDAKKYVVRNDWDTDIPEGMGIPGLDRPVLLPRPHYYDVLRGILDIGRDRWEDLVVFGDIFELDLALPLHMGARVILHANEHTPPYELAFLDQHPRAHVVRDLYAALHIIRRLHP